MLLLSPAVRSAGVRLRSLAALLLLSLQPVGGQSAPTRATPPLAFTLDDQFGKRWTEDSLSGRWTVLLAGQRTHADVMKAWSNSPVSARRGRRTDGGCSITMAAMRTRSC
jgi:hypothetical protein